MREWADKGGGGKRWPWGSPKTRLRDGKKESGLGKRDEEGDSGAKRVNIHRGLKEEGGGGKHRLFWWLKNGWTGERKTERTRRMGGGGGE